MGKFGKKVNVSTDLSDYMIGVMAPSGFGKTTLMFNACEKLFGSDGYIILDAGKEDGVAAIQGVVAEKVDTWKKMRDVVDDIVKNKKTDYPDLKVVILDTLDAGFEICESYVVDSYNKENMNKKDFQKATSINSVEGGYGRGLDRVIDTFKREIIRLNNVGVGFWWTAHVKEKEQNDLFTGASYTTLTANMSMKYFNSVKNSSHAVAFGYFDRSIEKTEIGEANPITKKKKERKEVTNEVRKMKFRDSALIADAKSRFKYIVEEIPLDADEFINAIKDAIEAERSSGGSPAPAKKTKKKEPVVEESIEEVNEIDDDAAPFDIDDDNNNELDLDAIKDDLRAKFRGGTAEQKKSVRAIMNGQSIDDINDVDTLNEMLSVFE